ncbi:MAG TPA: PBP1A family penicillin-binding protein [Thermoanaerobaculia bacterium]|nr:PBP1A family penicillin-binding protein [Thermoanaerobaculia bacterium]
MAGGKKRKARNTIRDFFWRHSFGLGLIVMAVFLAGLVYVAHTWVVITGRFDSSRRWDLPSRIYSDATPIVPGLTYPRELLEPKLNHLGYFEVPRVPRNPGEYRFVDGDLEIHLQNFRYPDMDYRGIPVRVAMRNGTVQGVRRIGDGLDLRGIRIEPELITSIFDEVMEDRVPVPLSDVPQDLIDAILAVEDRGFYGHEGISFRGIVRALVTNIREGERVAGGSTLTQQLVKNLFLSHERTYSRKFREALMAIIVEARYSKDEILEAYLNEIYLGQNGAVQLVGVEQAAQTYFGKHVKRLSLAEAATVAGIIRSPNVYSPLRNPERAKERRDLALRQMLDQDTITKGEHEAALAAPMKTTRFPRSINSAPYFVDFVMRQLRETYPETQLETEGLRVFTTLDTMMQRSADRALEEGIAELRRNHRAIRDSKEPLQGVVLTIQPGTGYVRALVGGRDYQQSQFNRALQAKRQPGSLFKPFVYVAAMDPRRGAAALTAASILDDSPISVRTGADVWEPENYDRRYHGRVTLRDAIVHSYNIPAVRAAIDAGVSNVIELASQVGVRSALKPYPSIALGSFEVTPLEIAYAYSVFANEGVRATPVSILSVVTREGKILENRDVKMERVAPAGVTYVMNDILEDVVRRGTAARVWSSGIRRGFAGKTGTTNDYRDAWFVGYSPRIVSLVWVGFDDNRPTGLSGSTGPVSIWIDYMRNVLPMVQEAEFRRPDDVIDREIDPQTGLLATPACPAVREELFVRGTEPAEVCYLHSSYRERFFPFLSDFPGMPRREAEAREELEAEQEAEREREKRERRKTAFERWLERVF